MIFEIPIQEVIAIVSAQGSWLARIRLAVFEDHEILLTCTSEFEFGESAYTIHADVRGVPVDSRTFTCETLNLGLFMDLWERVRLELNRQDHARRAAQPDN